MRRATLAHRAELLDDHMGDNNWKKLVNIGRHLSVSWTYALHFSELALVHSVSRKYIRAVEGASESLAALEATNRSADPADIASWTREAANAQSQRARHPEAMDIYEAKVPKRTSGIPCIYP
jgi:hypothetical protein